MSSYTGLSPKQPNRYVGKNVYLSSIVTRNRRPTSADYRQPETGKLYPTGSFWLVGENPTTGTQGDFFYLSKIVANVAYWVLIETGTVTTTAWTPAISFGGGTTGITYSQQIGQFYQLGEVVFFYFSMVLTNKGSSTGNMSITGLGAAGAPTPPEQAVFAVRCSNLTYTGMVNGRIAGGTLSIVLDAWASTGAVGVLTDTAFANNTFVQGNGSYLIT